MQLVLSRIADLLEHQGVLGHRGNALVHAFEVEGAVPGQRYIAGQRIRAERVVADAIAIAAPERREMSVKSLGRNVE
ncbi:MAG: hypothetical protein ACOYN7_10385 [Candidatus Nanopelagicales bacterium]